MHSLLDLALAGQLHRDRTAITLTRSALRHLPVRAADED